MKNTIIKFAVVVGIMRPLFLVWETNKHFQQSYQAVAHLFVGGLFGAWLMWNRYKRFPITGIQSSGTYGPKDYDAYNWMLYTALSLSVLEIICAVITILQKIL